MNNLDRNEHDDGLPIVVAWTCDVPTNVKARLQNRFTEFRDRIVTRPHEASRQRFIPRVHSMRWTAAVIATAAAVVIVVSWLGARPNAWAQVVKQMESTSWIHAKGQVHGESTESWVSVPRGIWASRYGKANYVAYASRESKTNQVYRSTDGSIVRLPMTPNDEESLRQVDALFTRAFGGAAGANLSTSTERLVKQTKSEVQVDGKKWLEFELTFRAVDGDHERVTKYRVDPITRMPISCTEKPQFADDPETRIDLDYPQSGPEDIFALGVPRNAPVVDHMPGPELAETLAGMQAGREKMDAYSGLIVLGSTSNHWSDASTVFRVWRSGNKWRIEQSGMDVPGPARRGMMGKDAPPRPGDDVDQQAWWKKAAETIRFYPVIVSDGKTSYRFKVIASPERVASREDWEKLRYEIESVAPDYISTPTADGGPTIQLLPEYVARPPLGIPSLHRQATLNPAPTRGPRGTILVSVRAKDSGGIPGQRVWVDPGRGYMAIRHELETGMDSKGNPQSQVSVIDEATQSPSGTWYPRVVSDLASSHQIGEDIGDQPAGITRYYLDFKSPIPPEVFSTPALKQIDKQSVLMPKPHTRQQASQRGWSMNQLSAIGDAMNSYEAEQHHFPAATIIGPDGKTPHSWRVALLPYLGHKDLFDRYNLAEPWDGPNNLKVLRQMPEVYGALEESKDVNAAYFLLTGEATLFPPGKALGFQDIVDGAANTLLAVEAKRDIPWTKPEDLRYEKDQPLPTLGGFDSEGFCVIFVDRSPRFIERSKFDDATIRVWITPAGHEKVKRPD